MAVRLSMAAALLAAAAALAQAPQNQPAAPQPGRAQPGAKKAPAAAGTPGAAVPGGPQITPEVQAKIDQYRKMGLDDKTATLLATIENTDDGDISSILPLIMLMREGGANQGDVMGMIFFMNLLGRGRRSAAPVAVTQGKDLLIVEGGRVYKIDTATMKVLGQVQYKRRGPSMMQILMPMFLARAKAEAEVRQRAAVVLQKRGTTAEDADNQRLCLENLKGLVAAVIAYANKPANGGRLPGQQWADALRPMLGEKAGVLKCPSRPDQPVGFALNRRYVGVPLADIADPGETILLFESKIGGDNPVGGADDVPIEGVHGGGINVGFADGHVQWMNVNQARRWLK